MALAGDEHDVISCGRQTRNIGSLVGELHKYDVVEPIGGLCL